MRQNWWTPTAPDTKARSPTVTNPPKQHVVGEDRVVADRAIVRHVRADHQQIVVADLGDVPSCKARWIVQFSRIVLCEPITTRPSCSGMRVCCGKPPRTAPSKTWLLSPSVVPLLITTRLASVQSSPIDDVGFDDRKGTNRDAVTELGLRADESLGMDVHRGILRGGWGPRHGWRWPGRHLAGRLPGRRLGRAARARGRNVL